MTQPPPLPTGAVSRRRSGSGASPARRVRDGELLVVAAVYDLRSRAVTLV